MGKIRDLFKKIRDTKGTFHAKICTIKVRNSKDLIESEEINKRWQENQNNKISYSSSRVLPKIDSDVFLPYSLRKLVHLPSLLV